MAELCEHGHPFGLFGERSVEGVGGWIGVGSLSGSPLRFMTLMSTSTPCSLSATTFGAKTKLSCFYFVVGIIKSMRKVCHVSQIYEVRICLNYSQ